MLKFVSLIIFAVGASVAPSWAQPYQHNVGANWDFTTAKDSLGWTPAANVSNFGVRNGALTFTAVPYTGSTSVIPIFSPSISVPTASMQLVEIVMSTDQAGPANVYWAPNPNNFGSYPGVNNFTTVGDGVFHKYYLPLDTSSASTIYKLGLNLPPGATVAIHSITVANLIAPTGTGVMPLWQFGADGDMQGWTPYSGIFDIGVSGGQLHIRSYTNSVLLAPAAQVTNSLEWFSLTGTVSQTTLQSPWVLLNFASSASNGNTTSVYFPVVPDSTEHVYNTNVGGANGWYATVSQLSITIPENTTLAISQMQIASVPQGPADVSLEACGSATPLIRAGAPFQVSCRYQSWRTTSPRLLRPADRPRRWQHRHSILAPSDVGYIERISTDDLVDAVCETTRHRSTQYLRNVTEWGIRGISS